MIFRQVQFISKISIHLDHMKKLKSYHLNLKKLGLPKRKLRQLLA